MKELYVVLVFIERTKKLIKTRFLRKSDKIRYQQPCIYIYIYKIYGHIIFKTEYNLSL